MSKNSSLKNQFSFESILLHRNLIQFFINARIELDPIIDYRSSFHPNYVNFKGRENFSSPDS